MTDWEQPSALIYNWSIFATFGKTFSYSHGRIVLRTAKMKDKRLKSVDEVSNFLGLVVNLFEKNESNEVSFIGDKENISQGFERHAKAV